LTTFNSRKWSPFTQTCYRVPHSRMPHDHYSVHHLYLYCTLWWGKGTVHFEYNCKIKLRQPWKFRRWTYSCADVALFYVKSLEKQNGNEILDLTMVTHSPQQSSYLTMVTHSPQQSSYLTSLTHLNKAAT
jgi:hypothetical protein